jgi:cytochrome P450
VRAIFKSPAKVMHAGEANRFMVPILGPHSVLTSDEDDHLRKLTSPMFHGEAVRTTALAWPCERLVRTPDVLAGVLAEPATIAGYDLPAGTAVAPAIGLVQRDGRVYDDPYGLRPQRFLGEASPPPYTWIPFGGGMRRCLGAAFA